MDTNKDTYLRKQKKNQWMMTPGSSSNYLRLLQPPSILTIWCYYYFSHHCTVPLKLHPCMAMATTNQNISYAKKKKKKVCSFRIHTQMTALSSK
jgi:hypothetical protein